MAGRRELVPLKRRAWLLSIGRHLRAEYDALAEPVPERLAALLKQLEKRAGQGDAGWSGSEVRAGGPHPE
ncbi:MAG TPA: NepR family anti-sigma factor [Xanthobacteraceae bacterium]